MEPMLGLMTAAGGLNGAGGSGGWLLALVVGICLSATCGFRIFVPFLGMSIAAHTGDIQLASGFEWIGSWTATTVFTVATVVEVVAYYVPWLDNLLDTVATPAAVVAGTIVTAAMVGDISPWLRWSLAAIAGGGAAAIVQTGTVSLRGASTVSTAGTGNFVVSTLELGAATLLTILAIVAKIVCLVAVIAIGVAVIGRCRPRSRSASTPVDGQSKLAFG